LKILFVSRDALLYIKTVISPGFLNNGEKSMNRLLTTLTATTLAIAATSALASPQKLITHNNTAVESNAYIAGTIPSTHPTKPYAEGKVSWTEVRMACFGHVVNGRCSALIKMNTGSANPIDIGYLSMDLNSGDITPTQLSANGYTIKVNGPGETTITKD